jgi:hypothetical protein
MDPDIGIEYRKYDSKKMRSVKDLPLNQYEEKGAIFISMPCTRDTIPVCRMGPASADQRKTDQSASH